MDVKRTVGTLLNAKIHYQDNLYYLHTLMKSLESGMKLSIDAEYFAEKIVEDLLFIDTSLMRMFTALKDNPVLVRRIAYLRALRRTVNASVTLLNKVGTSALPFAAALSEYRTKLSRTERKQQQVRAEIDAILDDSPAHNQHEELVSEQEFSGLLSDDDAP